MRQTLTAISLAPGAAPVILPPNMLLAAVMPATWVPCSAPAMPMLTKAVPPLSYTDLLVCTTNAMRSAIGVAGLSVPKKPTSFLTL